MKLEFVVTFKNCLVPYTETVEESGSNFDLTIHNVLNTLYNKNRYLVHDKDGNGKKVIHCLRNDDISDVKVTVYE